VKVTRFSENSGSKISGVAPKTGHPQCRIEIRTRYTGSVKRPLKTPRVITSDFTLDETVQE
jgi:hypothetical protein